SGMIQKGDTIVEVDGNQIEGISFHRVLEVMKGKEGSKTILGIMRPPSSSQAGHQADHQAGQVDRAQPEFKRVELTRAKITLEDKRVDATSEPFGEGRIGKITLHSFYEGSDGISSEKDLKKAIDQLKTEGPLYGLILDMRENSGGFLTQAVKVSGL